MLNSNLRFINDKFYSPLIKQNEKLYDNYVNSNNKYINNSIDYNAKNCLSNNNIYSNINNLSNIIKDNILNNFDTKNTDKIFNIFEAESAFSKISNTNNKTNNESNNYTNNIQNISNNKSNNNLFVSNHFDKLNFSSSLINPNKPENVLNDKLKDTNKNLSSFIKFNKSFLERENYIDKSINNNTLQNNISKYVVTLNDYKTNYPKSKTNSNLSKNNNNSNIYNQIYLNNKNIDKIDEQIINKNKENLINNKNNLINNTNKKSFFENINNNNINIYNMNINYNINMLNKKRKHTNNNNTKHSNNNLSKVLNINLEESSFSSNNIFLNNSAKSCLSNNINYNNINNNNYEFSFSKINDNYKNDIENTTKAVYKKNFYSKENNSNNKNYFIQNFNDVVAKSASINKFDSLLNNNDFLRLECLNSNSVKNVNNKIKEILKNNEYETLDNKVLFKTKTVLLNSRAKKKDNNNNNKNSNTKSIKRKCKLSSKLTILNKLNSNNRIKKLQKYAYPKLNLNLITKTLFIECFNKLNKKLMSVKLIKKANTHIIRNNDNINLNTMHIDNINIKKDFFSFDVINNNYNLIKNNIEFKQYLTKKHSKINIFDNSNSVDKNEITDKFLFNESNLKKSFKTNCNYNLYSLNEKLNKITKDIAYTNRLSSNFTYNINQLDKLDKEIEKYTLIKLDKNICLKNRNKENYINTKNLKTKEANNFIKYSSNSKYSNINSKISSFKDVSTIKKVLPNKGLNYKTSSFDLNNTVKNNKIYNINYINPKIIDRKYNQSVVNKIFYISKVKKSELNTLNLSLNEKNKILFNKNNSLLNTNNSSSNISTLVLDNTFNNNKNNICTNNSNNNSSTNINILKNNDNLQYKCEFCDKRYSKACSLGGHISRSHKNFSEKYKKKIDVRKKREDIRRVINIAKKDTIEKLKYNYKKLLTSNNGKYTIKLLLKANKKIYEKTLKDLKNELLS